MMMKFGRPTRLIRFGLILLASALFPLIRAHAQTPPGSIIGWGYSGYGETTAPAGLSNVTAIATGMYHTLALKSDGTVIAWGDNLEGQTNVPAGLSGVKAIAAGSFGSVALKSDGTVVAWGDPSYGNTVPAGLSNVTAIAAGYSDTMALKSDGTVVVWGDNGQSSTPAGLSNVTAIAAGYFAVSALKSDGTVVAWGNSIYVYPVPAGLSNVTAIAMNGDDCTVALKSDGTVIAWGSNSYGESTVPSGLSGVTAIAAGLQNTIALKSDGSLVVWGDNTYGETTIPAGLSGVTAIAGGYENVLTLIGKGTAIITLTNLAQTFNGAAKSVSVTTAPPGLAVSISYNGSATAPTNAGSYTVIGTINATNYQGSATNTLVIGKATGTVTLGNLAQTFDGTGKSVSAATVPVSLPVSVTYGGSPNAPTNAGSYTVVGTINSANYQGNATNTLVVGKATGTVTLGTLAQTFDGTGKSVSIATVPASLAVAVTYGGSPNAPTNAGNYAVIGTISDTNYLGNATNTLVIGKAAGTVTLGNLAQTFDGTGKSVSVATVPASLPVTVTYGGSPNAPSNAGSYTVIGTINSANYLGGATNTLVVGKATGTVTLGNLAQTFDGTAKSVSVTTTPLSLPVTVTYSGSSNTPTNAGTYSVIAAINNANYQGGATNILIIAQSTQTGSQLALSVTTSLLATGNRSFLINGSGASGTNVLLEYSTNLPSASWALLSFFTLPGQIEEAYDLLSTNLGRFYRLNAGDTMFTNPMFQGLIRYAGSYPNPANIPYTGIDGTPHTAVGAYPGWVELIADPAASLSSISNAIRSVSGKVGSAIPAAGLYWIQVTTGTEAVGLSNLFAHSWARDGSPAIPAAIGAANTLINVLDWNDPSDPGGSCARQHMNDVAYIAGSRRPYDMYDANDPQTFDVHDRTATLSEEVLLRMSKAYESNKRVVINLSLQSPASDVISGDKSGCTTADCNDIRNGQQVFLKTLLQMLEATNTKQPALANNTLISVIAGNAGVNLDAQLAQLKANYPNAFARMTIVGGTDASGNIATNFNHLDDNTVPNMVYARAVNVYGCSGTSFAAPEVTSVLDAIWAQATNRTSAEVLAAFHQVLGNSNIIPADANGKTTTNFINQVVALLNSPLTYYTLSLTTTGTGGGTASAAPPGPVYTNGTVVTLTAIPDPASVFAGWSGAASGTGNATVTMTSNLAVTATFNSTNIQALLAVSPPTSNAGSIGGCGGGSVGITISVTAPGTVTWQATGDANNTQYATGGGTGAGSGTFNVQITKPTDHPTTGFTCADLAQFTWYEYFYIQFFAPDGSSLAIKQVQVKWVELLVL